ncbi:KilA-N domain-containing protein, partial [Escherichia coli]|uniref:KilA-N domain-containing protein n=2 Tax=Gammaproteobacteria TaxID=1236 RepID=UPI001BC883E5
LKVSKAFCSAVISIHPVSVIFLYLKFVLLSLSANLGKKRDRQFNSMIGSARNTIPQGNNSASLNTGFELPITLIKLGNFSQKEMFIMSNLSILNTSIRTLENLYSLNDLHKISGGEEKHKPTRFMRLDQTKELIVEIQKDFKSPDLVFKITAGRGMRGTWACEELVLSYAMWISPKFHLIVLRAFLAMHRGEVKPQQLALPEPNYNMSNITQSEEVLALLIQMYSHLFQAHEMQEKLQNTNIAKLMESQIGGQYLYNFKHPLEQTMTKAKKFIQSNTERLALVKAMDNLLN